MVLLMAVSNLVLAADVSLKWDAVTDVTGYKIYKSEDMGVTWTAPVDAGNVTTYTYVGVVQDKMVLFKVSAYNTFGESIRHWSGAWFDYRLKPINSAGGAGIP
jgi:hypothetical protein